MRDLAAARDQFAYHPATAETAPKHAAVRDAYRAFLDQLWEVVPDGPEKTLALRALQESQMYSNLAIALTAPADDGETRGAVRVLPPEGGWTKESLSTHVEEDGLREAFTALRHSLSGTTGGRGYSVRLSRPLWDYAMARFKIQSNRPAPTEGHLFGVPARVDPALARTAFVVNMPAPPVLDEGTSRKPALADATQAPAVTEALAQSGVVRVTVDGHGFITAPGEWGVVELREEMGILPDRSLWLAERDGVGRTHLHRNETVVVQAGQAFFTTPEQPPAVARFLPADDAS